MAGACGKALFLLEKRGLSTSKTMILSNNALQDSAGEKKPSVLLLVNVECHSEVGGVADTTGGFMVVGGLCGAQKVLP